MSKILIVEDEIIVALDIRETIESLGYEVVGNVTNYEKAILFLGKNNQDSDAQFLMGICYYKLNDYKKSLDYLLKYLNKEKNNSQLYYYMGLSYFFLEDYKNSAKNLKISLKTDENNIDALSKLGIVYIKLNKKREAQKIANKLYYLDKEEYNNLNKAIKSQ